MSRRKLLLANNPLLSGPNLNERVKSIPVSHFGSGLPYREVSLTDIHRDPTQPRKVFDEEKIRELSESIQEFGILSPLLVREDQEGGYVLIAGERRLRAASLVGLERVPVIVEVKDRERVDVLSIQLIENLQREDLNPVEKAEAVAALRDAYGLSVRDIAKKLSVSKSMVQRSLDILNLPPDLLVALKNGASESKVLMLARVSDPKVRASLLEDLDLLTRSELQREISTVKDRPGVKVSAHTRMSSDDTRVSDEIQRSLGMRVVLQRSKRGDGGRLVVDFYNEDDLQEIFRRLVV
jgi:ParB family chromosome partitioning protein